MKEFSLEGKVALVTGAAGLLGREHCQALAEAGASVVALDLDESAAGAVAKEMPGTALGLRCDVTSEASLKEVRDTVLSQLGGIDVLVNNAAINDMFENPETAGEQSKFENYPVELFRRSLEVNVTGMFLCSQILGTEMANRKSGSIVNVASTYGLVGPDQRIYRNEQGEQVFTKSAAYPATKGAVVNFTRFLATYWGEAGVRVNTLSPGGVSNGQDAFFVKQYSARTPLGRMAERADYRGAVVFLASDASSYMTGANLVVDGGWTAW